MLSKNKKQKKNKKNKKKKKKRDNIISLFQKNLYAITSPVSHKESVYISIIWRYFVSA
jgi:hypothetical protein